MILVQLHAFYFQANKIREESMEIANAAYETPFWNFTTPMKKKLILIIQRAQKPMQVGYKFFYILIKKFNKCDISGDCRQHLSDDTGIISNFVKYSLHIFQHSWKGFEIKQKI